MGVSILFLNPFFNPFPKTLLIATPIADLTMTQVLGAAHVRGLPWDTLMLVAGIDSTQCHRLQHR